MSQRRPRIIDPVIQNDELSPENFTKINKSRIILYCLRAPLITGCSTEHNLMSISDAGENVMTLYEYLRGLNEKIPAWLDQFKDGDGFSCQEFLGSRLVYYPGSGTDGHPVKVFGSTHSAHCFIYADYGVTQAHLESELDHPEHGFEGYHRLSRLQLRATDLAPEGWTPHVPAEKLLSDRLRSANVTTAPFGFLEVLERDCHLDDSHGARRLAILFLGADGIAAYDALFCQGLGHSAPFAILLQDHGFGGGYEKFGRDGLLDRIARDCNVLPQWLLVARNTTPWELFEQVADVDGDPGGVHHTLRFLYEKCEE